MEVVLCAFDDWLLDSAVEVVRWVLDDELDTPVVLEGLVSEVPAVPGVTPTSLETYDPVIVDCDV